MSLSQTFNRVHTKLLHYNMKSKEVLLSGLLPLPSRLALITLNKRLKNRTKHNHFKIQKHLTRKVNSMFNSF